MAEIVLVDDDANILASVRIALEADGFSVRSYTDGHSALVALKPIQQILDCSTLKCREWTGWNCFENCDKPAKCQWFFYLQG